MTVAANTPNAVVNRSGDRPIPFAVTEITDEAQRAALAVLRGGWVTTGPESLAFETELARYVGSAHAVAVSSCTAAVELALRAYGLPPGARVLTPTMTFAGAVHAIVHAGLRPVLVDVDERSLTMNAAAVEQAAAQGADVLVVQHMAGYPAPVPELAAAAHLGLDRTVEDAAHGLAGSVGDVSIGHVSRATCFSFYATKNLPIGEGGAITTDDADLVSRLRALRLHGMSHDAWRRYQPGGSWRYTVLDAGLKANLTDLHAAIGRAQLAHLDGWQRRREALAQRYDLMLGGVPGIELPARPASGRHAWHLYVIRVRQGEFGSHRDALSHALAEQGIGTSVHFIPVHHHPYFRQLLGAEQCERLSTADRIFPTLLSLPLHPLMSDADVDRVASAINDVHCGTRRRIAAGR